MMKLNWPWFGSDKRRVSTDDARQQVAGVYAADIWVDLCVSGKPRKDRRDLCSPHESKVDRRWQKKKSLVSQHDTTQHHRLQINVSGRLRDHRVKGTFLSLSLGNCRGEETGYPYGCVETDGC